MHTDGEWFFDGAEWVSDKDGYDVAQVGWRDISGDKSEMIANGHLIAAAPDLLEACIAMSTALADIGKWVYNGHNAKLEMGRAAIAKATKREM